MTSSTSDRRRNVLWSQRATDVTLAFDRMGDARDGHGDDGNNNEVQLVERIEEGDVYAAVRIGDHVVRLFAPVTDVVAVGQGGGSVVVRLAKADGDAPFWPSLTGAPHAEAAPHFIVRIDWSRWVDDDDDGGDDGAYLGGGGFPDADQLAGGGFGGGEFGGGGDDMEEGAWDDEEDDEEDEEDDEEEEDDDDGCAKKPACVDDVDAEDDGDDEDSDDDEESDMDDREAAPLPTEEGDSEDDASDSCASEDGAATA